MYLYDSESGSFFIQKKYVGQECEINDILKEVSITIIDILKKHHISNDYELFLKKRNVP